MTTIIQAAKEGELACNWFDAGCNALGCGTPSDILVSTPERVATLIEKQPECLKKSVT